ncbi:MAG: hypothetical protein Q7S72_01755 [Candidatus Taylorbacteria bacterium]|nr:hypothetical protein [Candidatus Taylorbacteria bacterium]
MNVEKVEDGIWKKSIMSPIRYLQELARPGLRRTVFLVSVFVLAILATLFDVKLRRSEQISRQEILVLGRKASDKNITNYVSFQKEFLQILTDHLNRIEQRYPLPFVTYKGQRWDFRVQLADTIILLENESKNELEAKEKIDTASKQLIAFGKIKVFTY